MLEAKRERERERERNVERPNDLHPTIFVFDRHEANVIRIPTFKIVCNQLRCWRL